MGRVRNAIPRFIPQNLKRKGTEKQSQLNCGSLPPSSVVHSIYRRAWLKRSI
jgi:hypothetical protein